MILLGFFALVTKLTMQTCRWHSWVEPWEPGSQRKWI